MPDDAHRPRAVVRDGLDAERPAAHPERADSPEADEERRGLVPGELRDLAEAAPVFVSERQREQEVADGREARGGQAGGRGGAEGRNAGDRVGERQRAGGDSQAPAVWRVSVTRPKRSSSPPLTGTGVPVATRDPLTNVPFITPISSIRYSFPAIG